MIFVEVALCLEAGEECSEVVRADSAVEDLALADVCVRGVKAALLYADRVTLASPNAIMLAGVAGLTVPDSQDRRDALIGMASVLPGSEDVVALYEDLKRRRSKLSPIERIALTRMEKALKTSGDEMADGPRDARMSSRPGSPRDFDTCPRARDCAQCTSGHSSLPSRSEFTERSLRCSGMTG
ncbi:MAG: hypothetical protein ACYC91_18060 [Solirubrobacteraceae bacterium]